MGGRFTVFPNPFQDRLTIRSAQGYGLDSWVLRDISGRVVTTGTSVGHSAVVLDLGPLPMGTYWVEIISGNELVILPVIRTN